MWQRYIHFPNKEKSAPYRSGIFFFIALALLRLIRPSRKLWDVGIILHLLEDDLDYMSFMSLVHHIDFGIAVVLCGEGQMLAIRREAREHFITIGVVGEFVGNAALDVDGLEVATIAEHHIVAVDGRKAQHFGFLLGRQSERAQQQD